MSRDGAGDGAGAGGAARPEMLPAAERYCAWAGRSGGRTVFSVLRLDPSAGPWHSVGPGVLLGIRREPAGRRVLWSAVVTGASAGPQLRRAVAALRRDGRGELHHCAVAGGPAACARLAAELGRPPLEGSEELPLAC